jgi:hypothetical protein
VAPNKAQVKVTGLRLTNNSLVLATAQQVMPGIWVRGVTHTSSSITILLNKAVPSGVNSLFIGWFIVK